MPDIGPTGFTFNQFLIDADGPAIFHTRPRAKFPVVSEAVASLPPLERLRWTMFGHLEADECGAMNLFLAAAPKAQVAHTAIGCTVSINDLADRTCEPIPDDGTIDLGGRRVRSIATPHVPDGWNAHVIYEETTGTTFETTTTASRCRKWSTTGSGCALDNDGDSLNALCDFTGGGVPNARADRSRQG